MATLAHGAAMASLNISVQGVDSDRHAVFTCWTPSTEGRMVSGSSTKKLIVSLRTCRSTLSSAHCLGPCDWFSSTSSFPGRHSSTQQQAAVCMSLPTGNAEIIATKGYPKWSARAIKSYSMAELEARKLKYPNTGTEALLMGMLTEGTSQAARYLRANKVTLFGVRDETIKLLGKADMYFFSPEHPPLTEPAQKALDWAMEEKRKSGGEGEITTSFMLLGIWAQKGSAGQQVLAALEFDDEKAEELRALMENPVAVG